MKTVSIVYFSGSGTTESVAKLIATGIETVALVKCHVLRIIPEQIINGRWKHDQTLDTLAVSNGIIFGSPTYMGSIAAPFKAFMETTSELWASQSWKNKIAGGFTCCSSPSGDNLNSLIQLAVFAAQHGMVWVGQSELPGKYASGGSPDDANRLGSFLGLATQVTTGESLSQSPSGDRQTAILFGRRIAEITKKFNQS